MEEPWDPACQFSGSSWVELVVSAHASHGGCAYMAGCYSQLLPVTSVWHYQPEQPCGPLMWLKVIRCKILKQVSCIQDESILTALKYWGKPVL